MRGSLVLAFLVSLACGGDDGGGSAFDATPGADSAQSSNPLGQVCTASPNSCPGGATCVILSSGSDTMGYCSPTCNVDAQCTDSYTGPGTPVCFNPTVANTCTITCELPTDCPTGLECVSPGGPGAPSFCVAPE